jgi:hypothetical protein
LDISNDPKASKLLGIVPVGIRRIANFKHENKFWIADIPTEAVAGMAFQLEWFKAPANVPAAHAQILVTFPWSRPIKLYTQSMESSHSGKPDVVLRSLILSATGAGEVGTMCELVGGTLGHFSLVYGIYSAHQRYSETKFGTATTAVDSFALTPTKIQDLATFLNRYLDTAAENFRNLKAVLDPLTAAKLGKQEGSEAAIERARSQMFEKATYRTFTRNCSTSLMDLATETGMMQFLNKNRGRVNPSLTFYPPAAAFVMHASKVLNLGQKRTLDLDAELNDNKSTPFDGKITN